MPVSGSAASPQTFSAVAVYTLLLVVLKYLSPTAAVAGADAWIATKLSTSST